MQDKKVTIDRIKELLGEAAVSRRHGNDVMTLQLFKACKGKTAEVFPGVRGRVVQWGDGRTMPSVVQVDLDVFEYSLKEILRELEKPTVVVLCGSTRFYTAFQRANYEETMKGRIVLSVGFFVHSEGQAHGEGVGCTPDQKRALDELHKRKIDMADEVLVLNVGGYIGDSTRGEIAYAELLGKPIRYLEPPCYQCGKPTPLQCEASGCNRPVCFDDLVNVRIYSVDGDGPIQVLCCEVCMQTYQEEHGERMKVME